MTLRAIDICSGAGGWACAARGLPIRIEAAVDMAEDCLATYRLNHPSVETIQADVREMDWDRFAGVDLILGGIPCEEISQLRTIHKTSAEDIAAWRRTLTACLRAVEIIRPRFWCFEDTPGIVKHLPAGTPVAILDSAAFSAQRRRRAYVGRFPRPRQSTDTRPVGLLRDHLRPGPYRVNPCILEREPARSRVFTGKGFIPWHPDEISPTVVRLTSRHDNYAAVVDGDLRRQLEWQELASLQGFPNDYVFVGSPTKVSKMIGQAVQIDTGRAILREIVREAIEGGET
ncbi:MAG: DNA cytosine methyltransferase [Alphaproteobacteria bacterium]